MNKDLNEVSSEYLPNAATEIENDLILNWYPHRIVSRFQHTKSLLELGIGHGFTPKIFNDACDHHVVIDGSSVVIDQFKEIAPECSGISRLFGPDCLPNSDLSMESCSAL